MKTTTVAFIMHRKIDDYRESGKKIKRVLSRLIEEENAETFLFSVRSYSEYFCLAILTDLKRYYPLIKRVYIRQLCNKLSEMQEESLLYDYDEVISPEKLKDKNLYNNRYRLMVDKCDILVTYYDKDYTQLKGKQQIVKNAVKYALKENKRIINLADE